MIHQEGDLSSSGFGIPWGHTRVYGNILSQNSAGENGNSWLVPDWQYLVLLENGTRIGVVRGVTNTMWFDRVGSDWVGQFSIHAELSENTTDNEFVLRQPDGTTYRYHDFSGSKPSGGRLKSVTSAGDVTATLTYDSSGRLTKFLQSRGAYSVIYDYNYSGGGSLPGGGLGLLRDVMLTINETVVKRAVYSYYGLASEHGSYNDLEKVVIERWRDSAWESIKTNYYRYWKGGEENENGEQIGVSHGLKYILDAAGYDKMVKAGYPPEADNGVELAKYASHYFEYNAERGVSQEVINGGQEEYSFQYESSNLPDGNNTWKTRTTETRPDGSEVIVYTNYAMGVILRILKSGNDQWYRYVEYADNKYRAVKIASSMAVASTNTPNANQALEVTLKDDEGLITLKDWYDDDLNGGAKDFLKEISLKRGAATGPGSYDPVKQRGLSYVSHTHNGFKVFEVSEETEYLNESTPLKTAVTSHAYDWHPGTSQVKEKTTTLPAVSDAENGDDQTYFSDMVYNLDGQLIWSRDALGIITQHTYDEDTGARKETVNDFQTNSNTNQPSGWETLSEAGENLVTTYTSDPSGRIIQTLGPPHTIDLNGTAREIRRASLTTYLDAQYEVRSAQGYQLGGSIEIINPVTIQKNDASGRTLEMIQAEYSGTNGLSPDETYPQSSYLRWQTMQYSEAGRQSSQRVYYNIPVGPNDPGTDSANYDQMNYGYDLMGRQDKVVSGGGTITQTIFDVRGLTSETFIGTNDAPGTSNMVKVSTQEYDHGNAGDNGNLTRVTQHVSDTEDRVTQYDHDWRDRRTVLAAATTRAVFRAASPSPSSSSDHCAAAWKYCARLAGGYIEMAA